MLVSNSSQRHAGTRSKYEISTSSNMSGMCVTLTYAFSAAAISAPICIAATGLSERELSKYRCIYIIVEGLCVDGSGVALGRVL